MWEVVGDGRCLPAKRVGIYSARSTPAQAQPLPVRNDAHIRIAIPNRDRHGVRQMTSQTADNLRRLQCHAAAQTEELMRALAV